MIFAIRISSFPAVKFQTRSIYPFNVCYSRCNLYIFAKFIYACEVHQSTEKDVLLIVAACFWKIWSDIQIRSAGRSLRITDLVQVVIIIHGAWGWDLAI
jgi:hypothetical protein